MDSPAQNDEVSPAERVEHISPPSKRQKRTILTDDSNTGKARQSKACSNCRKLKIKCHSADHGASGCSRCSRLGLSCLRETKSWARTDEDNVAWQTQLTITKLERALEDVLEKLHMPALDLYVSPAIVDPQHSPQPTRRNSEEPTPLSNERDVSPDPMNSLIEATQLNGMRSQLRSVKLRRKGGMRRMDSDIIAEKVITLKEAEQMLSLFKQSQSHHLFSAGIAPEATLDSIRASSTVLFTAIILVAALHVPGKEALHEMCHSRFSGLVASVMFDRFHTLDDIRGLCIAAFWEPHLSWKLSGLSIRMATELNLHHAFYEAFNELNMSVETRKECLEKARLWYLLYVLDHQSSIAYGRPPVMSDELRPIQDYEALINSEYCEASDHGLLAQVTGLVTLSRAFKYFGLEPKRAMEGDDASILNHQRYTEKVQAWKDRWMKVAELNPSGSATESLLRGVELHYHFSNLVLYSLVLRGRPLHAIASLPVSLRPLALKAIESAHLILQHFINDPVAHREIVGMPLYLHSMIAFAVVFLMKIAPRWQAIGITIDPVQRTIPLVEKIVALLQGCEAGKNHMVFSMAKGFERMSRHLKHGKDDSVHDHLPSHYRPAERRQRHKLPLDLNNRHLPIPEAMETDVHTFSNGDVQSDLGSGYDISAPPFFSTNTDSQMQHINGNDGFSTGLDLDFLNSNWSFQDEELWSVGMGYDLLEPGGSGRGLRLADNDFQGLFFSS